MRRLLTLTLVGALAACTAAASPLAEEVDDPFSGGYPSYRDSETGYTAILGTPDLATGTFRVAFALFDAEGLVQFPVLTATTHRLSGGALGEPFEERSMRFYEFPFGGRGLYSAEFTFDGPGRWALQVAVPQPDGRAALLAFPLDVAETAVAPVAGDPAPPSLQRTARDVDSLVELSTGHEPDPHLYEVTVAEALEAARPFVVVFASPAFCTNALCGPQVEMLSDLADEHGERARFIHIDIYENPHEIKGDLTRARRTPILEEWGVYTDEWTFVVGADGRVVARFEAFVAREELEAMLLQAIEAAVR